jgi:hypothetical protein
MKPKMHKYMPKIQMGNRSVFRNDIPEENVVTLPTNAP